MPQFIDVSNESDILRYFYALRSWHAYIRLVDLVGNDDTAYVPIERLFVEPGLSDRPVSPNEDPGSWPQSISLLDALEKHRHLVILGDPGTGKSTIVSWLTSLFGTESPNFYRNRLGPLIPIPLVLRDLNLAKASDLDDLLAEFLRLETPDNSQANAGQRLSQIISLKRLRFLMEKGQALLILDGMDEVPSDAERAKVRQIIYRAEELYPQLRVVITSRVVGYDSEPCPAQANVRTLMELAVTQSTRFDKEGRQVFPILGPEDAQLIEQLFVSLDHGEDLLRSIMTHAGSISNEHGATLYVVPFDPARVADFSAKWHHIRVPSQIEAQKRAEEFVAAVERDAGTRALGRIPNLLTFMALVHRKMARLPDGRANLYREIADAYLDSIDLRRNLTGVPYALHQKKEWLGRIAFALQVKRTLGHDANSKSDDRPILIARQELRSMILSSMVISDANRTEAEADDFVDYLARRSGLLVPRSPTEFSFVHLSFQEYFAALEICRLANRDEFIETPPSRPQNIDLAAVLGQKNEIDTDPRALSAALPIMANLPSWAETLLLAMEADPPRSRSISARAFGRNSEFLGQFGPPTVVLAARTVMDDFNGLNAKDREQILNASCKVEWTSWLYPLFADHSAHTLMATRLLTRNETLDLSETRLTQAGLQFLIEHGAFENLAVLELSGTGVQNATPMANLAELTYLNLSDTVVQDVTPLATLTNLTSLDLSGTGVQDITPLTRLKNLTHLFLSRTGVQDVTPLANLTNLTSLDLSRTSVQDITPLTRLKNLTHLFLSGTGVQDVSHLANLTHLTILNLSYTRVQDLTPLTRLTNLTTLNLSYTRVQDITPLTRLKDLTNLYLSHTGVQDATPLADLKALQCLYMSNTHVSDISAFEKLSDLSVLFLSRTKVRDVRSISKLTHVTVLSLIQTEVQDVSPLANLTNLTSLRLSYTKVQDITPLASLTNLTALDFIRTGVQDVTPLANLTNLTSLDFSQTAVQDVTPLANLTNLTSLDLSHTAVQDATPLCNLVRLKQLSLPEVGAKQVAMLRKCLPKCSIDTYKLRDGFEYNAGLVQRN